MIDLHVFVNKSQTDLFSTKLDDSDNLYCLKG